MRYYKRIASLSCIGSTIWQRTQLLDSWGFEGTVPRINKKCIICWDPRISSLSYVKHVYTWDLHNTTSITLPGSLYKMCSVSWRESCGKGFQVSHILSFLCIDHISKMVYMHVFKTLHTFQH